MWISLFVVVIAVSICFGLAAILMRDGDKIKTKMTRLLSDKVFSRTDPIEQDLNIPLASSNLQLPVRADLIDRSELRTQPCTYSVQLHKPASSTFAKAVGRLRNMSAMMCRLGFDAKVLARRDLNVRSVFHDCQKCSADEVCHDWLARAPKSLARAPAFCPNAKRFAHARHVHV